MIHACIIFLINKKILTEKAKGASSRGGHSNYYTKLFSHINKGMLTDLIKNPFINFWLTFEFIHYYPTWQRKTSSYNQVTFVYTKRSFLIAFLRIRVHNLSAVLALLTT